MSGVEIVNGVLSRFGFCSDFRVFMVGVLGFRDGSEKARIWRKGTSRKWRMPRSRIWRGIVRLLGRSSGISGFGIAFSRVRTVDGVAAGLVPTCRNRGYGTLFFYFNLCFIFYLALALFLYALKKGSGEPFLVRVLLR